MAFILGIKKNMTQIFDEAGNVIPVTLVEAGPALVTQVKTKEKDGYPAVQLGFGKKKEKNIKKPQKGHLKKVQNAKGETQNLNLRWLKEFKVSDESKYKLGDVISASVFKEGDKVRISGTVKGRGFQGVVKRHGFHGGPRTHGQKHSEREAGSIGGGGRAGGRVIKGMKMPGRMGGNRMTTKGLKIIKIDEKNNLLAVSGAVPGARGGLVEIRK
ncbi:MAG: 50S ribosomal protein L3 [Patescibacteria group bacterium]